VFRRAAEWLERNKSHESFYLHIDCFDPHEPWDPPEDLVKMFDPNGYKDNFRAIAPYRKWKEVMDEAEFVNFRARYAAMVVMVDKWLGKLMDKMDEFNMWKDTMVILTTDHGTFNGDRGRIGKLQTHEYASKSHIPFIVYHPEYGHGQRRDQLVQLVDIYPTVLKTLNRSVPPDRHGIDLTGVLADKNARTRDYAVCGFFGNGMTITDGRWTLHQAPIPENKPLYWYDFPLAKFLKYDLGPYINGRREVFGGLRYEGETWLSDRSTDWPELINLADKNPNKLLEMQKALKDTLIRLKAPPEQLDRLGIRYV